MNISAVIARLALGILPAALVFAGIFLPCITLTFPKV